MTPTRNRRWFDMLAWAALAALVLATAAHLITRPPAMPDYDAVRAAWKPSEAWLYDREGRLLDSERVNFERRRLAWVSLKDVNPAVRDTVVAAEDKRFWSHGGVDWLAMASAARARWTGGRSRPRRCRCSLRPFSRPNWRSRASAAGSPSCARCARDRNSRRIGRTTRCSKLI